MSKDRSEELQDHHNQGQEDAKTGDYDPPRGWVESTFTRDWVKEDYKEDNDAYNKGYENGKKQR